MREAAHAERSVALATVIRGRDEDLGRQLAVFADGRMVGARVLSSWPTVKITGECFRLHVKLSDGRSLPRLAPQNETRTAARKSLGSCRPVTRP
jgi:hypothetical protein